MEYLEYKPHPHLAKYIECYWSAYSDKPPFREHESLIPDRTIELMFNFGEHYDHVVDGGKEKVKGSHVIGIRRHSLTISQTGKQHFFCIRFKLGGTYPFFKIPAYLFANSFHSVHDLLGNHTLELEDCLYEARSNQKRVEIADKYFLAKLDDHLSDYLFVDKCMPQLLELVNVKDVARRFNTSYKGLERKFSRVTGLTPSELIKINRFNQAVLLMYSCRYNSLTSIAHASGYYDQSHFIREFKQLTNFTPKEFLKEQFTIVQVIQPALADRMSKSYNF